MAKGCTSGADVNNVMGICTTNVVPQPKSDRTAICMFRRRANRSTIARPSPNPSRRLLALRARKNSSKMCRSSSALMPGPESRTSISSDEARRRSATKIAPSPAYFTALPMRFRSTRSTRTASLRTKHSARMRRSFKTAFGCARRSAYSVHKRARSSVKSKLSCCGFTASASSRASSNKPSNIFESEPTVARIRDEMSAKAGREVSCSNAAA